MVYRETVAHHPHDQTKYFPSFLLYFLRFPRYVSLGSQFNKNRNKDVFLHHHESSRLLS